jgi:sulfate transport system permease protein
MSAVEPIASPAPLRITRAAKWRSALQDPPWTRLVVSGLALLFVGVFLVMPLAAVLLKAFERGLAVWQEAVTHPDTWAAFKLTLLVVAITVPCNTAFGVAAAWAIARFRFPGRSFLISLIDLPFSVSPVIAGLVFVLVFGSHGFLGPWLAEHDIKIVFAWPGIVLATMFVTFPFVARELIPLMQEQGPEEEEAAITLGATGWQTFFRVTLPNIKWGLFYGIVLCNARAVGEFGAVSVVSGHIRGETNTLPLHVEILYNDYMFTAAFAVASLLAALAIVTLIAKSILEMYLGKGHHGH